MKAKILLSFFLLLTLNLFGQTTKYVAAPPMGNDANPGTKAAPYATLTKALSMVTGVRGDSILLRNGDRFPEMVYTTKAHVYWGTWDKTGAKSWIYGYRDLSTLLTAVAGRSGLYEYQSSTLPTVVRSLMIDRKNQIKGRWPRSTWRTYEDTVRRKVDPANPSLRVPISYPNEKGIIAVIDNELSEEVPYNFNGTSAEVIFRKNNWAQDRQALSLINGDTIYTRQGNGEPYPTYEMSRGFGYFIQNDYRLCTQFGDWAFDSAEKKIYVFLGAENPTQHEIWVTDKARSFNLAADNNVFQNIIFAGHNDYNLITGATGIRARFEDCEFLFSGYAGVYTSENPNWKFYRTRFYEHVNNGLYMLRNTVGMDSCEVVDCEIRDIGMWEGMGKTGSGYMGIQVVGDSVLIRGNKFRNIGYNPIYWAGAGVEIAYNDIDSCMSVAADGGGIYSYHGSVKFIPPSGVYSRVHHNFINNVFGIGTRGVNPGTWDPTNDNGKGFGIYFDEMMYNTLVYDNIIMNVTSKGFMFHNNYNIKAYRNIIYKAKKGVYFRTFYTDAERMMTGMEFKNNQIYLGDDPKQVFIEVDTDVPTATAGLNHFGIVDSNFYYKPNTGQVSFWTQQGVSGTVYEDAFAAWKTRIGGDNASVMRTRAASDALLYNPTQINVGISGTGTNAFTGENLTNPIILPAYSGFVVNNFTGLANPPASAPVAIRILKSKATGKVLVQASTGKLIFRRN